MTRTRVAHNKGEGSIVFRYSAKNVYMVASAGAPVDADIYLDGAFLKTLTINEHRLYDLVQGESYGEHVLEIRIQKGEVEAYTFTFG